jgi:hypothetical protein
VKNLSHRNQKFLKVISGTETSKSASTANDVLFLFHECVAISKLFMEQ